MERFQRGWRGVLLGGRAGYQRRVREGGQETPAGGVQAAGSPDGG